jgi:tryptophan 2,3-dioxygenase
MTPAGRSFGEEGGLLTYGRYLRLPELLAQQVPQVVPPAHDELLFITVHQAYELWFQQLLHELTAVRDHIAAGELWKARQLLGRAHVIERLLVSQVDVLETMTPQDFLDFRAALAPASGFQSVQFRELEFLSGLKDPRFVSRFRSLTEAERARLGRRLAEPSLWDAYLGLLGARGLPASTDEEVLAALVQVARDRGRSRTMSWPGCGAPGTCRWWSGRSGPSPGPAGLRARRTCRAAFRSGTTRCCGSCGTFCKEWTVTCHTARATARWTR